ncbi:MAG: TVP38/TMEM64 family protein [Proteobacteria bacterium]|nr:TVP38/TMEM64 family protein [Pseudomonadota bacterium]MBU1641686.1 TVP38/TMEM64 family protein [Pseudomonadota bacterium]
MQSKTIKRLAVVGAGVVAVGLFFYFDLAQYLTLEHVKGSQARFQELYAQETFAVVAGYMAVYIMVTALSLPGAVIMTLAGGALFGVVVGSVVVSFASTIGATVACFVARFILRDWVQERFAHRLAAINKGIDEEGGFYLFSLRLVPVFPFFVINLVMGMTRLSLWRFYWISQLGMLPGTIVYVNAGKELGKIDSLGGILSPGLLVSFIILGLFPITVKKLMVMVKRKRISAES